MSFIVVYKSNEECFLADTEAEIIKGLEEYEWDLSDCCVYEQPKPIEFEIKLVRKQSLVRKEK